MDSRFWFGIVGSDDVLFVVKFPRLFRIGPETKEASVAVKLSAPIDISFRRNARGGIEEHLLADLTSLMDSVTLSNSGDRWVCDLVSDGNFRVKEIVNSSLGGSRQIVYDSSYLIRSASLLSRLLSVFSVCEEDVCHSSSVVIWAQLVLAHMQYGGGLDPHDWSSFQEWQSWFFDSSSPIRSIAYVGGSCSSILGGLSGT
ncbi:hypothetical protein Tco_0705385 [Tanacetum coccineum]|uniref:Uncharacterized protein n=1 Tax=Tanacetum coccineum TaxID=301880 RepID=A0ABQ4Y4N3_9ASTR